MVRFLGVIIVVFLVGSFAGCASPTPGGPAPEPSPFVNPWATVTSPVPGPARSIGGYSAGCLVGAIALPESGPGFLRAYPDRDRPYGHPRLVAFLERLGRRLRAAGERPILVGDLGLPRGGPTLTGHASHQTGLDVDIAFRRGKDEDPHVFGKEQRSLLARLARSAEVDRIFVNPRIKQALCAEKRRPRWLRKVRPWFGHDTHYHVRLACPPDSPDCAPTEAVPEGDGCDATLAWWDSDEAKAEGAAKAEKPLRLPELPPVCAEVLSVRAMTRAPN